jgi:hypothetical protein
MSNKGRNPFSLWMTVDLWDSIWEVVQLPRRKMFYPPEGAYLKISSFDWCFQCWWPERHEMCSEGVIPSGLSGMTWFKQKRTELQLAEVPQHWASVSLQENFHSMKCFMNHCWVELSSGLFPSLSDKQAVFIEPMSTYYHCQDTILGQVIKHRANIY